jgi:hypothetical protein
MMMIYKMSLDNPYRILLAIILFNAILLNSINGQSGKLYQKEKVKIFQFFQDSILSDSRYFNFSNNETIRIRNFLSNSNLFLGVSLYSLNSAYENATIHSVFSEKELNTILSKMTKDTLREKIGFKFNNYVELVGGDSCLKISKPIFEKNFNYCFLSYGWFNSSKTSIDGSTILLYKKNGKWTVVRKVGDLKRW